MGNKNGKYKNKITTVRLEGGKHTGGQKGNHYSAFRRGETYWAEKFYF